MKWIKKHSTECVVSVFWTIAACIFITSQFTYLCDTNDDVLLRNIVSGGYTGTPDAHLIYIMYPLGLLLKSFYSLQPQIAWYDWFMTGLHYTCWFLLAARIGSRFEGVLKKTIVVSLSYAAIVLIDLKYIVMHQYTVLAAVAGAVALLWILTDKSKSVKAFVIDHIVTVIMLTLCLWLRNQVFLMLMPFVGIAVILRVLKAERKENKKLLLKYAGALAVVAVIVGISFVTEKIAYSSEEWQKFLAYNEARTDVYDFYQAPPYDIYKDAYAALGFNEYDALVIVTHNIALMPEVDTQTLETLADWSLEFRTWQEQYYSVYRKTLFSLLESILYNPVQPIGTVLIAGYAVALLLCFIKDRKKDALAIISVGLFQCIFVAYFLYQNRFPERVSYGFYFMQLIFLLGIWFGNVKVGRMEKKAKKQCFWGIVFASVIAVVGINAGMYCYKTTLDINRERCEVATEWEWLKQYCEAHGEQQFLMKTNAVGAYCETMFKDEIIVADNMHYLGTWLLESPLYVTRLQNAGMNDCGSFFVQNSNGCMLQLGNESTEWLTLFYNERGYTGTVEITDSVVLPDGGTMSVLQMKK